MSKRPVVSQNIAREQKENSAHRESKECKTRSLSVLAGAENREEAMSAGRRWTSRQPVSVVEKLWPNRNEEERSMKLKTNEANERSGTYHEEHHLRWERRGPLGKGRDGGGGCGEMLMTRQQVKSGGG